MVVAAAVRTFGDDVAAGPGCSRDWAPGRAGMHTAGRAGMHTAGGAGMHTAGVAGMHTGGASRAIVPLVDAGTSTGTDTRMTMAGMHAVDDVAKGLPMAQLRQSGFGSSHSQELG
jgi:hypothetical protein